MNYPNDSEIVKLAAKVPEDMNVAAVVAAFRQSGRAEMPYGTLLMHLGTQKPSEQDGPRRTARRAIRRGALEGWPR